MAPRYENKAAYDAHMASVAMDVFTAGVDPLVTAPPRISIGTIPIASMK